MVSYIEQCDDYWIIKDDQGYAWSHREGKDDKGERFVAVLEIPPVESALTAVRVQIMKDIKTGYSK